MKPTFFKDQHDFRKWLAKNHKTASEIVVGYYKVGSGKANMSWSESVDQAICFGWIDGIRKSIDDVSYCIRFTPRKPTSNWSAVNIRKVEKLIAAGLMQPAGLAAYEKRREDKSRVYSFENRPKKLPAAMEKLFKANKAAWGFFSTQPPGYRKMVFHWILDAKREATQLSRLEKTIAACAKGERLFG